MASRVKKKIRVDMYPLHLIAIFPEFVGTSE